MSMRNEVVDSAISLGASINGSPCRVDRAVSFIIAAQISSASSLNGVLKMQASVNLCDQPANIDANSWFDVAGNSATVTANGVSPFEVAEVNYVWVRLVYTRTGGSATMTSTYNENIRGLGFA